MSEDDDLQGQKDLVTEVESGDELRSLIALRDYVAHELQGNRCKTCEISKLRTGDTAALVLRLQKIIEDISAKKPATGVPEGVITLDDIRARRAAVGRLTSTSSSEPLLGTKKSERRQSGRQPRFKPS